ncbi:hypothetical protein AX777_17745 [Sphingobium yanoikuyae]|uniref:Uncharacterized protein n=1 Tax=Sphingobium yanoikuyae TaxID=13690 RepID=A0A177JW32_SPHYA|nr:hypothetical protein [Sphingobium yanoikuyae]OAH45450.1 hypothetical protein AX777_17745 [Sphingobium yanoikuyae]
MEANKQNGHPRAISAATMSDEHRAALETSRPTAEEIAADRWADEPDTAPDKSHRAKLRLPFRN